jgi:hypothetical protein
LITVTYRYSRGEPWNPETLEPELPVAEGIYEARMEDSRKKQVAIKLRQPLGMT